jgi:hypothetical protein
MSSRTTARLVAGTAALGAALLCSTVTADAALTAPQADAFFVSASGPISVAATPHSTYPPGGNVSVAALSVGPFASDNTVSANTTGDPSTGDATAEAQAENLALTLAGLGTLNLGAIDSKCTATPSGSNGTSSIASATFTTLLGTTTTVNIPNGAGSVDIAGGLATLKFFPSSTDTSTGVLTIDALQITLLHSTQTFTIAQASCGGAPAVNTNPSPMISAPVAAGAGAVAMVGGVVAMRRRKRGKSVVDGL